MHGLCRPLLVVSLFAAALTSAWAQAVPQPKAEAPQSFGYAAGPLHNPSAQLSGGRAVRNALLQGGYIIYFRHGKTDLSQISRETSNRAEGKLKLDDCHTQRNLSDEGRAELKTAGKAFRQLKLPLGEVLTSPMCRTRDTAAAFADAAKAVPLLAAGDFGSLQDKQTALEKLFSQRPPTGKNTLIVAHGLTLRAMTGFAIGEGHAVVLKPGDFKTIVARIAPDEWAGVLAAP